MYDFAHPIEDAIEGITHSICTLEFEDHRPLYDWVVQEIGYEHPPKQIEFAKLYLTNVITGKRYIKRLVDEGIVDGWDDPRLVTIAALRRRGFTPESIKSFMELVGVTKSNSSNDYAMLEYCIRNDLKPKAPRVMAVLDPIKLVIDNYPEGQVEYLDAMVNMENPDLGYEKVPFERELWIDRDDFMEEPPKKYFRLFPGNEVRLMNAYFVKCVDFEKDENGKVTVVHCTYDPITKNGTGFTGRKVKGTIHWVPVHHCKKVTARLYENLVDEEKGVYNEDGSLNLNPNSLTVIEDCYVEPAIEKYKPGDSFQFVRNGYFCIDSKPIEVCRIARSKRCSMGKKDFRKAPGVGYCASQSMYYYGYKLHAVCWLSGIIHSFDLTKASVHDIHYLKDVKVDYSNCTVIGDRGYISAQVQLDLFETANIRLEVPYRCNQKEWKPTFPAFAKARKRIETLFSQYCVTSL